MGRKEDPDREEEVGDDGGLRLGMGSSAGWG